MAAEVAKQLEKKHSDACNEDVTCLKDNVQYLVLRDRAFMPPLMNEDKVKRGFHYPQLARLVCPITWLEKFDLDRLFCQQLRDRKLMPAAGDLPLLLFDEETFDMEDLFTSFLRNIILAWHMIFIGPKAALDGIGAPCQGGKGNIAKNHIKYISVPTLAYLATLVYFALNSDVTFYAGGGEHFDYSEFYWGIIYILTIDVAPEQLKELLSWWDQKVFPNYLDYESDEKLPEDIVSAPSGHSLLKAQLCKGRDKGKGRVVFDNSTNTIRN